MSGGGGGGEKGGGGGGDTKTTNASGYVSHPGVEPTGHVTAANTFDDG